VLFVSSHAQLGGSESYLERLVTGLGPDWCAGVVLLEDGPLAGRLRGCGVAVHVVPVPASPLQLPGAARRLRRALPPGPLVHANGVKAALVCAAAELGRRPRRLLWVKHDFRFDGLIGRLIAGRCLHVVGVSAAVLVAVSRSGLGRRVPCTVVSPSVVVAHTDRRTAARELRALLGVPQTARVVLMVGRLDVAKGFEDLIEMLPDLARSVPDVVVGIVGPDEPTQPGYRRRLKARADGLGVGDRVVLTGPQPDAARLIAGANALVVASHAVSRRGLGREGFGLVGVEAFAVGTPVVGYATGALPEVLGDAARLVPPGDRSALGRELVVMLTDRAAWAACADSGARRYAAQFREDRTVTAMTGLYRTLAATLEQP